MTAAALGNIDAVAAAAQHVMASLHVSHSHGGRRRRSLARQDTNRVSQFVVALRAAQLFCLTVLGTGELLCREFPNWCPAIQAGFTNSFQSEPFAEVQKRAKEWPRQSWTPGKGPKE